jgi:hyperosmotically inducible protein
LRNNKELKILENKDYVKAYKELEGFCIENTQLLLFGEFGNASFPSISDLDVFICLKDQNFKEDYLNIIKFIDKDEIRQYLFFHDPLMLPESLLPYFKKFHTTYNLNFSYKINDLNISAEVQYRILWNKKICSKDIIIKTTNGVVNLDGTVRTATEKKLAKVIACNTRSVRQVVNTLKIENDESNASKYFPVNSEKLQVYSDQKITTVLYKNTLLDKLLRELDLSFATKHGVVTVKGTIKNQQQHAYILDMVQSTPGIEAIKDLLTSK